MTAVATARSPGEALLGRRAFGLALSTPGLDLLLIDHRRLANRVAEGLHGLLNPRIGVSTTNRFPISLFVIARRHEIGIGIGHRRNDQRFARRGNARRRANQQR